MSLLKTGQMINCCHPNALMTLSEFMEDYASEETREVGYRLIEEELKNIPKEKVRTIAAQNIEEIRNAGGRDFRF
jgi:2-iminoacetate synthase